MSRSIGVVKLPDPGPVGMTGPTRKAERFQLDYATWRAHLAAPGSRFESAPSASPRMIHLDTVIRPAGSASDERRTA
jgi:hypothetical protein